MIRFIIIALLLAAIAFIAVWFGHNQGIVAIDWLGYEIEMSVAVLALAMVFLIIVLYAMLTIIGMLMGMPIAIWKNTARRSHHNNQIKGYQYLEKALIDIASKNYRDAETHLYKSKKLIGEHPTHTLLSSQIAKQQAIQKIGASKNIAGKAANNDSKQERELLYYKKMLENPQTEIIGLTGMLDLAFENRDYENALKIASEGIKVQDNNPQIILALINLYSRFEQYNEASWAIDKARKISAISSDQYHDFKKGLYAWQAVKDIAILYDNNENELPIADGVATQKITLESNSDSNEQNDEADANPHQDNIVSRETKALPNHQTKSINTQKENALKAYKIDNSFTPVIQFLVNHNLEINKPKQAMKYIEQAWSKKPNYELAIMANNIWQNDNVRKNKLIYKLYNEHPNHYDSLLMIARLYLQNDELEKAQSSLEQAQSKNLTKYLCQLMMVLAEKQHDEHLIQNWSHNIKHSHDDNLWQCVSCNSNYDKWQLHCDSCGEFMTIKDDVRDRISS